MGRLADGKEGHGSQAACVLTSTYCHKAGVAPASGSSCSAALLSSEAWPVFSPDTPPSPHPGRRKAPSVESEVTTMNEHLSGCSPCVLPRAESPHPADEDVETHNLSGS